MSASLVIIGCGGFGREVFGIVMAVNAAGGDWTVEGFVDDGPSPHDLKAVTALGSVVLGTIDDLAGRRQPVHAVVAIGAPSARRHITSKLASADVSYPALVHPDATIGADITLGPGSLVAAGARLSTAISLGRHVHVDQNATVGHDTLIGDFVRLNPQACISGSVTIGEEALIGASATVLQGLRVGAGAIVGAGAVVVRDVESDRTVKGVPAR